MTESNEAALERARSDNLRTITIKLRGEYGAGKSQLAALIARQCESFGMQVRLDSDGHNITVTSSSAERARLYEHNRAGEKESKPGETP